VKEYVFSFNYVLRDTVTGMEKCFLAYKWISFFTVNYTFF